MAEQDPDPSLAAQAGEIVVDIGDQDLVLRALIDDVGWRAYPQDRDESARLGLVRLSNIEVPASYQDEIRKEHEQELSLLEPKGQRFDALDILLFGLRKRFAARFGGWVPLIGKNRLTDGVFGNPQHKSDRDPKLAEAPLARAQGVGSGVRIGVIDTPLTPHPDLTSPHVVADELFSPQEDPVAPWAGHATFVAGLIHAQAPEAVIDVRAVLRSTTGRATSWDTANKIVSFAGTGIDVLNLSLGCRTADGEPPLVLSRAIERLTPDVLITASAGNHADNTDIAKVPIWPGAMHNVVAVGAVDVTGADAPFSPKLPWVDWTAIGVDVTSTYLFARVSTEKGVDPTEFKGYARWSGTSFAAATLCGAVAARIVPGKVSAHEALQQLLNDPFPPVQKFTYRPDRESTLRASSPRS